MLDRFDAAVIGGGPGGYVAAIRLGQLEKRVLLVERDRLGGECLNYGCIPSKALITVGKLVKKVRDAGEIGIRFEGLSIDFAQIQRWKASVVERLSSGISQLCKGNSVNVVTGKAEFSSRGELNVTSTDGVVQYQADNVIVATGSRPIELPELRFDGSIIVSSKEMLELEKIPRSLLIVGGGAIGLEIGFLYAHFGTQITVVEIMDQVLPGMDPDLVRVVARSLERLGAKLHLKSRVVGVDKSSGYANVTVKNDTGELKVEAERVMVSVGKKPNSDGLGLERIGVELDSKGFIKVDKKLQTNIPGVFAVGDVVGPPFLAHKASKEGMVAAEVIAGLPSELDYSAMPIAVFTDPEIASTGLSEKEAVQKGFEPIVGRFPFHASGRAVASHESDGLVKVVAEKSTRRILGIQIVGPAASDIISEGTLAIEMSAVVEDITETIHPHPTLPESLLEAAEASIARAIHILNR